MSTTTADIDNRQLRRLLHAIGACAAGQEWLGDRDLTTAWAECPRGDHVLWACVRIGIDHRLIVRAAAACAETTLRHVPKREDRPRLAIEAARAWADAPSKETQLRAVDAAHAASDAYAAYTAAHTAYTAAAYAYTAAAYTAYTAKAASVAAQAATSAAQSDAQAAYTAAYAAAYTATAAHAHAAVSAAAQAAAYATAAAHTAYTPARTDALTRCAAIVREHIPFEAVLAAARQTLERLR